MIQSKCSKIDKRPIGTTKYVLIQTLDFGFWIVVKSDNIVREGSRENKKTWPLFFPCFALAQQLSRRQYAAGFDQSTSSRTTSASAW